MRVRIIAGIYEDMTGEVVEINFDSGMSRVQLDNSLTVSVRNKETEAIEDEEPEYEGRATDEALDLYRESF